METSDDQWWFWTPEWQAAEAEVDAALTAGDVVEFSSADELLEWLSS